MRSNLKELLSVLEEIRANDYPDIPANVIEDIVAAQYDNQDKRMDARNKTIKIIAEFLNQAVENDR